MTHHYGEIFSDWSVDKNDEFSPGHHTSAVIFHQIFNHHSEYGLVIG